jgi:hypothetical protein
VLFRSAERVVGEAEAKVDEREGFPSNSSLCAASETLDSYGAPLKATESTEGTTRYAPFPPPRLSRSDLFPLRLNARRDKTAERVTDD